METSTVHLMLRIPQCQRFRGVTQSAHFSFMTGFIRDIVKVYIEGVHKSLQSMSPMLTRRCFVAQIVRARIRHCGEKPVFPATHVRFGVRSSVAACLPRGEPAEGGTKSKTLSNASSMRISCMLRGPEPNTLLDGIPSATLLRCCLELCS